MPYLKKDRKELIDDGLVNPTCGGDLNYVFTKLAIDYLERNGKRYETMNTIVGAFESAKAEFQRRVMAPYEDTKVLENGDVYPTAAPS